jgi:hypothetical protein
MKKKKKKKKEWGESQKEDKEDELFLCVLHLVSPHHLDWIHGALGRLKVTCSKKAEMEK